jgi:Uma2 family endonuclease
MATPQQTVAKEFYTEAEYFEFEKTAEGRWEFIPVHDARSSGIGLGRIYPVGQPTLGRIRMMAGGTADHAAIAANIIRILGNALVPRGCRVFGADLKVRTGDDVNTFPDISAICTKLELYANRRDVITNPLLIIEILSDSTAKYDMGEKFAHYQTIPSLKDYLLVFQDTTRAILHSRAGDHWETRIITGADSSVYLLSVDVTLALADIYTLVEFDSEPLKGTTDGLL